MKRTNGGGGGGGGDASWPNRQISPDLLSRAIETVNDR